jgi:hypothetical protein
MVVLTMATITINQGYPLVEFCQEAIKGLKFLKYG